MTRSLPCYSTRAKRRCWILTRATRRSSKSLKPAISAKSIRKSSLTRKCLRLTLYLLVAPRCPSQAKNLKKSNNTLRLAVQYSLLWTKVVNKRHKQISMLCLNNLEFSLTLIVLLEKLSKSIFTPKKHILATVYSTKNLFVLQMAKLNKKLKSKANMQSATAILRMRWVSAT